MSTDLESLGKRDYDGVESLLDQIRRAPDNVIAQIRCFNQEEAVWIRSQLEARGVDPDRITMTWLAWDRL